MENKKYLIHDNGDRPYKVVISGNYVEIFDKLKNNSYKGNPFYECYTKKIFIGKSPICETTLFSGAYGDDFDGNTILILNESGEYIFIGQEIFSFFTYGTIKEYVSHVGNSDVPYVYAIDIYENIYLLSEDVILRYARQATPIDYYDTPYKYYYSNHHITKNLINTNKEYITKPPIYSFPIAKIFCNFKKYMIDSREYYYRYNPQNINDIETEKISESKPEPKFIIDVNDNKIKISEEMGIDINNEFGHHMLFEPLIIKKMIRIRGFNY